MDEYDALLIGAGQAAIPLARSLSAAGRKVAVAERKNLGGSCVNFGCTPTKAVVASARVAHLARRAAEFGLVVPTVAVDFPKVLARAKAIVDESKIGLAKGLRECGADVLQGHASLVGRKDDRFVATVDSREVSARQIVIDVGARTLIPPLPGLTSGPFLHAGNWLDSPALPAHIIFIGAGYIALEMAQFYRRMGARVTVIGRGDRVAPREDAEVSEAIAAALQGEGVSFRLGAKVTQIERGGRETAVRFETAGAAGEVLGDAVFIAVGRTPNTGDLGLQSIGVQTDADGSVEVNERLAARVPGVWAAGDARGGPMFTHASWDDHRVLESQMIGDGSRTTAGRIIPYAIFTDPELGRVGMTEGEARRVHGQTVRVASFQMQHNGKAAELGETKGFIKVIADSDDRLLGAAVLASEGAELAAMFVTLMNAKAPLDAIRRAVYTHPTLSEAVQSAVLALGK